MSQLRDCKGNTLAHDSEVKTGLPSIPTAGEWIINEIMFNPRDNGYDFAEFLNNSNKIFDASTLFIANRNGNGAVSSITKCSTVPFLVFPGEHIVLTEDRNILSIQYLVKFPQNVLEVSMPSFPNEKGTVITTDAQGIILDELNYDEKWHFKLLENTEGVSLERINPLSITQDPHNWHSAASTAGYGTPGYGNSQHKDSDNSSFKLNVTPPVFSPDNDGRDDFCSIHYLVTEPGFTGNIIIFNATGRPVRLLASSSIMGISGYWNWDGLDDKGAALPAGTYIIFAEIFNLQGKKEKFKKAVVLARKLN